MKQELTQEQVNKLVKRAVGYDPTNVQVDVHADTLEWALAKNLLEKTEMRRELRRLNQSVRHINALESQVRELTGDVNILEYMLDREDQENNDTDPAPPPLKSESLEEWDMRTRFGVAPRKTA